MTPGFTSSFCCIHVCKAQLKPELYPWYNYTSVGLQGHSITSGACQCLACCWNFWTKTIPSWFKKDEEPACSVITPLLSLCCSEGLFAHGCSGYRIFEGRCFSLLELIKCLYINLSFAVLIPLAEFCLSIKSNKWVSYWILHFDLF